MDQGELNNLTKRKRLNDDASTLRDRVSRDVATVVKLKVGQDTKLWDLKEKLQQSENSYERLQQKMVELQMKQEATMAHYQEEIRLRPETLNKVKANGEICSVLEEYSGRLKDTLTRCKADQVALCSAYQQCEDKVKEAKQQQLQKEEKLLLAYANVQEKVKLQEEYRKNMQGYFESTRQQMTNEIEDLKVKLTTACAQKDELANALNNNVRNADAYKQECNKKDERISNMQKEMQQFIREYTSHNNNMKDVMTKQENDLKESIEERDSLKKALENSDQYNKSVCDENKLLQEKISTLEEENMDQRNIINELEASLKDAAITTNRIERDAALLIQNTKDLENTIEKNNKHINNIEEELKSSKSSTSTLEAENAKLLVDVNSKTEELKSKTEKLEETTAICKDFEVKIQIMESDHRNYVEKSEANIKELQTTIQLKDKELNSNCAVVNKLMSDIKESSDVRNKLEMALESVKHECEMEKELRQRDEATIAHYQEQLKKSEVIVKNKDDEIKKQISVILEMMKEKKRFQETIQEMQNKIDNIQKEITGPTSKSSVTRADLDDNAAMAPPRRCQLTPPPDMEKIDKMIFNLFSDDSEEDGAHSASKPPVALRQRNRIPKRPAASQGAPKPGSTDITGVTPDQTHKTKERKFFKTRPFKK